MDLKKISQSSTFKGVLYGIGITIVVLLIFQAGLFVGYHRAGFSYRFGDNYYRAFGDKEGRRPFMGMPHGDFPNAHGTIGKIVKIDLPTIVVEDRDQVEKVVLIKDTTVINQFHDQLKATDLKTDQMVVVIGSPNDQSQIEAKVIRIIPAPPTTATPASPTTLPSPVSPSQP